MNWFRLKSTVNDLQLAAIEIATRHLPADLVLKIKYLNIEIIDRHLFLQFGEFKLK